MLKAKQIIKDSFWILEANEQKIGTMRHANNTWQVLLEKDKKDFNSYDNVIEFLGEDPFTNNKTTSSEQPIQGEFDVCLLYTSPSPRDNRVSRMPSSA